MFYYRYINKKLEDMDIKKIDKLVIKFAADHKDIRLTDLTPYGFTNNPLFNSFELLNDIYQYNEENELFTDVNKTVGKIDDCVRLLLYKQVDRQYAEDLHKLHCKIYEGELLRLSKAEFKAIDAIYLINNTLGLELAKQFIKENIQYLYEPDDIDLVESNKNIFISKHLLKK